MLKEKVIREDGRYIVYYSFEECELREVETCEQEVASKSEQGEGQE
jgi:hypothetical protein